MNEWGSGTEAARLAALVLQARTPAESRKYIAETIRKAELWDMFQELTEVYGMNGAAHRIEVKHWDTGLAESVEIVHQIMVRNEKDD